MVGGNIEVINENIKITLEDIKIIKDIVIGLIKEIKDKDRIKIKKKVK